jgi:hypothetical protein
MTNGKPQPGREPATGLNYVLNVLMNGFILIEPFVFLFFLRSLALGVHNRVLSQRIVYLMMVAGAIVIFVIGLLAIGTDQPTGPTMRGPDPQALGRKDFASLLFSGCGCTIGILFLTFSIWYIVTLFEVRTAISVYLRRLGAAPY